MLYTVEVQSSGSDVGATMSHMRTWLDHHRFEPDSFRQIETNGAGIMLRLEFKIEGEAFAFATAFGGRVSPLTNNGGRNRSAAAYGSTAA